MVGADQLLTQGSDLAVYIAGVLFPGEPYALASRRPPVRSSGYNKGLDILLSASVLALPERALTTSNGKMI
jgi:hypothetical protein